MKRYIWILLITIIVSCNGNLPKSQDKIVLEKEIDSVNAAPFADFIYNTELCECQAKFDSTLYSRTQIQNTLDYLFWAPNIDTYATAWTLNEIKNLDVISLEKECNEKIKKLQTLEFVDDTFWNKLKNERIEYYKSTCNLKKYTILAHSNPDTLLYYKLVDSSSIFYRDALISGGQELIQAWIRLNEDMKSHNGYPEKVQERFDAKFNSPNQLEYARLDIMKFGWWNSANRLLPHINTEYSFETEFERLFIKVDCECDEP